MSAAIAGAVLAPIIGGMAGNMLSGGDRKEADEMRRRALMEFAGINAPSPEEQRIVLEQLRSEGRLTPELEQAFSQGDSRLNDVSTDPRLKDAQLAALTKLQGIGAQGGMDATDRARFSQMQGDLGRQEAAQRGAIMQDMARRGQSGSGMELASQLMNQQSSAERASQQGMEAKAQAERRALEAIMQGGQLAGGMQSQEFAQKAAQAQAQDAINRFNTQNRQQVMGSNVDRSNNAQASNLQNQQRISDVNVGMRNQQEVHNKGLTQQHFQNQVQLAGGRSGQLGNLAGAKDNTADRTAGMWAGIGSGVGEGFAAYGKKKKDEE